MEFAILCAARTDEVLKCTPEEIDEKLGVWRVPGQRMKGREDHTVFLSPRALVIALEMKQLKQPYLFPSPMNPEKAMSSMAMLTVLKRMKFAASSERFASTLAILAGSGVPVGVTGRDREPRRLLEAVRGEEHARGEVAELLRAPRPQPRPRRGGPGRPGRRRRRSRSA